MTKEPSPIVGGPPDKPIKTFAFITLSERLPEVLVKCLDTFHRTYAKFSSESHPNPDAPTSDKIEEEAKKIIGQFSKLRYELMTDKPLELLSGTAEDIKIWNDVYNQWSAKLGTSPVYFSIPWLYAECYMYRKIGEIFDNSEFFKGFDPFREQKCRALTNSIPAILSLAEFLANYRVPNNEDTLMDDLRNILEMSLWGNKCDLSLSAGADVGIGSGLLGKLKELRPNILINDCDKLLEKLKILKTHSNSTLDIILDNAGYELFTDLCLIEFLHITNVLPVESSRVRFYVKNYPWFVSDAMVYDFHWTIKYLEEATQSVFLQSLGKKMQDYLNRGVWTIENDLFFTLPHDFSHMEKIRPKLYEKLSGADLILLKGDLNYRKLVGDLEWPLTSSFEEALRGFCPSDLCTLRSIKAEVCVGFKNEDQYKSLPSNWMISSDFAVVQYLGDKKCGNNVGR